MKIRPAGATAIGSALAAIVVPRCFSYGCDTKGKGASAAAQVTADSIDGVRVRLIPEAKLLLKRAQIVLIAQRVTK